MLHLVYESAGKVACLDTAGILLPGYSEQTIADLGCALTTAATTLNYFGISVDPPTLNTWMRANGGYTDDGRIKWGMVSAYAFRTAGIDIGRPYYYDVGKFPTNAQFDSARLLLATQICRYGPSNVQVFHPGQHWVTAFGRKPDSASFRISDPNGGVRITLATPERHYNNEPHRIIFWRKKSQRDPRTFGLHALSPVELIIIDPLGRRLGYDPRSGTQYTEIPDAVYSPQSLSGDQAGDDDSTHEVQDAEFSDPVDGVYQVQVIGTDTGTYRLQLDAMYLNEGTDNVGLPETPTWPGAVHAYSFTYMGAGGQSPVLDHGSFAGGGQSSQADDLLTYSTPGTKSTNVPQGIASVPVTVYLSPDVTPSTVLFTWNGQNVTPSGLEAGKPIRLSLPVTSGRNIFLASADGVIGGRRKSDSDRLVFIQ